MRIYLYIYSLFHVCTYVFVHVLECNFFSFFCFATSFTNRNPASVLELWQLLGASDRANDFLFQCRRCHVDTPCELSFLLLAMQRSFLPVFLSPCITYIYIERERRALEADLASHMYFRIDRGHQ